VEGHRIVDACADPGTGEVFLEAFPVCDPNHMRNL
jgi:hypothetical protein